MGRQKTKIVNAIRWRTIFKRNMAVIYNIMCVSICLVLPFLTRSVAPLNVLELTQFNTCKNDRKDNENKLI